MATQREIRKRIQSVSSTMKITKTMEMVATSKMKKMQDRLKMSKPYADMLDKIIINLRGSGLEDVADPLLFERSFPNRTMILIITGNRGLCGSYNNNVINNALSFKENLETEEGKDVLLYAIGKKAINHFKFIGEPLYKSMPNPDDNVTFDDTVKLAEELIELFISGEIDSVHVSYTKVISSSSQKPTITRLLPITQEELDVEETGSEFIVNYIFEPNPYKIFSSLLPLFIKINLYQYQLESGYSEQFARRVSMMNATDAATDMVRELTISYNRARQAKITNEIAEIVGGASALQ